MHGLLMELMDQFAETKEQKAIGLLGLNKCLNFNAKLSRWNQMLLMKKGKMFLVIKP